MRKTVPVSSNQPLQGNYQHFDSTGRQYIPNPNDASSHLRTTQEIKNSTQQVARGCVGLFDTSDPDDMHFGRTLSQVWSYAASGQFRIVAPPQYHWVQGARGVRPLVLVQWVEYALADKKYVRDTMSKNNFLPG